MRNPGLFVAALTACVVVVSMAGAAIPDDQKLAIVEAGDSFQISVPVSRLVMAIPRGTLQVVKEPGSGAAAGPRYFHLEDTTRGIVISGWFEPAQSYKGIEQFWKGETAAWKKNHLPKPKDVSIIKIGKWDAILYDITIPGASNTHIRGEWVEAGTWIDVHISVTTEEAMSSARATARSVIEGIRISGAQ